MKKLSLSAFLVLLTFVAANAFACPTAPTGPYFWNGLEWYDYTQSASCYSFYGSGNTPTSTTLDCGYSGWQFGSGNYDSMRTSFTIGATDPILNANHWRVITNLTFISPDQTSFDYFAFTVYVRHSDNSTTTYTLYTHNGSQGNLTGCNQLNEAYFSATHGDTVTVELRATILYTTATIKATPVTISNEQ
jgi:hypothetical protein